jgi:hypothetical protein
LKPRFDDVLPGFRIAVVLFAAFNVVEWGYEKMGGGGDAHGHGHEHKSGH